MQPDLKFAIDIELDTHVSWQFLQHGAGGVDFSEAVYDANPEFAKQRIESEEAFAELVQQRYEQLASDFEAAVSKFQSEWQKVADKFFQSTTTLFHGHQFPEGEYMVYLAINKGNPRFLEQKSLQVFYQSENSNAIIAHELLHFLFYSYCESHFHKLFKDEDPESGTYWILAEIFNNIVLSLPMYKAMLNSAGDEPYPDHAELLPEMIQIWNTQPDVEAFIPKAFERLKSELEESVFDIV